MAPVTYQALTVWIGTGHGAGPEQLSPLRRRSIRGLRPPTSASDRSASGLTSGRATRSRSRRYTTVTIRLCVGRSASRTARSHRPARSSRSRCRASAAAGTSRSGNGCWPAAVTRRSIDDACRWAAPASPSAPYTAASITPNPQVEWSTSGSQARSASSRARPGSSMASAATRAMAAAKRRVGLGRRFPIDHLRCQLGRIVVAAQHGQVPRSVGVGQADGAGVSGGASQRRRLDHQLDRPLADRSGSRSRIGARARPPGPTGRRPIGPRPRPARAWAASVAGARAAMPANAPVMCRRARSWSSSTGVDQGREPLEHLGRPCSLVEVHGQAPRRDQLGRLGGPSGGDEVLLGRPEVLVVVGAPVGQREVVPVVADVDPHTVEAPASVTVGEASTLAVVALGCRILPHRLQESIRPVTGRRPVDEATIGQRSQRA